MGFKKVFFNKLRQVKKACSKTPGLNRIYYLKPVLALCNYLRKQDPNVLEQFAVFDRCYEQHTKEFSTVSGILADEFSKRTFEELIKSRRTGKLDGLKDVYVQPQYFQKDIIVPVEDEVFVDGGAFRGETVRQFIKFVGGGTRRSMLGSPIR